MKAVSCTQCRNRIHKEEREEFLKHEYAIYKDIAFTMAVYSTVAALAVQIRRGRSKEYIQALYDDMIAVYDTSSFFGKEIKMDDMMKSMEKDYGIDFKRIKPNLETEQEFIKGVR